MGVAVIITGLQPIMPVPKVGKQYLFLVWVFNFYAKSS